MIAVCHRVSILTRPEGRVRHPAHLIDSLLPGFNPHPTRRPGATLWLVAVAHPSTMVSILTRPEGRVRQWSRIAIERRSQVFQSSPDPKAGCDGWRRYRRGLSSGFQSSPDPKAGCDLYSYVPSATADDRFNPHPTRRPGATSLTAPQARARPSFNPHPTRRPGATAGAHVRALF